MSFKFESSYDGLITRADLKKLFWRSIPYEHSWNYERMGHIGFMWALMPILRKLYPQDADFKAALKRHMELYNVTPYISTLPMSIAAAMDMGSVEMYGVTLYSSIWRLSAALKSASCG